MTRVWATLARRLAQRVSRRTCPACRRVFGDRGDMVRHHWAQHGPGART